MNYMTESLYEIGTDEAAAKLGLSSRSVRRLGEKGILEGKVEVTSVGKQWFFKKESLDSLIAAREEKLRKEERHRVAQDTLGHDRRQPRTTEDMTEPVPTRPMIDEKRVDFLEKLIEKEREEHAQTKGKLEQKETLLLEKAEAAARLQGREEGYEKLIEGQREVIGMLRDTVLKLQQPSASDNMGRSTEDNRGRLRITEDMTNHVSEAKNIVQGNDGVEEASEPPEPTAEDDSQPSPQSSQEAHSASFSPDDQLLTPSEERTHTA